MVSDFLVVLDSPLIELGFMVVATYWDPKQHITLAGLLKPAKLVVKTASSGCSSTTDLVLLAGLGAQHSKVLEELPTQGFTTNGWR